VGLSAIRIPNKLTDLIPILSGLGKVGSIQLIRYQSCITLLNFSDPFEVHIIVPTIKIVCISQYLPKIVHEYVHK
jgi:hypothetical protein